MEDSKRWTVTYTKHLRQKRKVYQDGFLDLHFSTNKVKLYDECEKLLECRILKKDETVASGETLEFNGYLVDIGGPEGHNNLQSDLNVDRKHNNGSGFRTPSKDTKINAKENISRPRQPLSPSQRVIKDFKKRELLKYASPRISSATAKPSTTEYLVLYTKQLTQKAKKYHDGFLRQVICGSRGEQVMLFDASRKLLDSRFVKKDDIIRPGESIAFDAYLVEIGEHQASHKPVSSVQGDNCNKVETIENMDRQQTSLNIDTHATVGKSEWHVLYTTQLTQKAKKYHDGFLQLEFCGSRGRQVVLYDLSKRPLGRRFLKKDEVIRAGESVYFDGHLVKVGEPEGSHQSPVKLNERGTGNSVVERKKLRQGENGCLKVSPSVAKEQPPSKPCFGQDAGLNSLFTMEEKKSSRIVPPIKPLRDVNQILSILQGPMPQESDNTGGPSPNNSCQNIMDRESTETMKSLDITSSKAACGGGSFQFTENLKMSQQLRSDKEAQTNMSEADTDVSILSSSGHSSCLITSEDKNDEVFSSKMETFPSFDLGF